MSHTNYVNASGLPDDDQNSYRARPGAAWARDPGAVSALLQVFLDEGVCLSWYGDAQPQPLAWRCRRGRRHQNRRYTRASGFNLVTSVHRDGRYIVAVVLGGHSASERDTQMREG